VIAATERLGDFVGATIFGLSAKARSGVDGSQGATMARLRMADFETVHPAQPQLTLSILLRGKSRSWRDIGEGYRIPKGAEAFRHRGAGILTAHGTAVGWRVEGQHDCLIVAFPVQTSGAILEEILPHGAGALYRLADRVVRDPLLPVLAQDIWDGARDRIGAFEADYAIALMLARLARQASGTDAVEARLGKERLSPANLRRAMEFLRAHVASDPSLNEIAAATGLSPFHFLRGFKAATGMTPFQSLRNLRIEIACDLLSTGMPIAQVALEVGFKSQSHFGAVFRRAIGQTPASWRGDLRA
tara:strand:+ start:14890 stop:15795 length:906 start_codon:yes stop_codon:yes gene_type:complete